MRWHATFLTRGWALLLMLLFALGGWAQVSSFKHFGLDQNVFPSRIECLDQASSGELVIGTLAGMVIYDGHRFRQVSERDGLAENAISAIGVWEHEVWLGHWAGSLTRMNILTGQLSAIDLQENLNFSSIMRIMPVGKGSVLLVTREGGLYYYLPDGLEQIVLPKEDPSERVVQLRQAGDEFHVITDQAIYKSLDATGFSDWQLEYRIPNGGITDALRIDREEWVIGTNSGVMVRNIRTGEVINEEIERISRDVKVVSLLQDMEEFVWIGSAEQGTVLYHPITKEIRQLKRDNGLSYNQVRSMFMDREGIVWVATSAGLDQYLGRSFLLFDRRFGLPDNLIWDFAQMNDQTLLATPAGLFSVNIDYRNASISEVRRINVDRAEPRRVFYDPADAGIWVIDAEGALWKGNDNGDFRRIESIPHVVRCIENVNGEIWVGTDQGVFKLQNGQPSEQYTAETGLGGNKVNGIYYSKTKNETWVTVLGGPATLYREGRFRKFGPEEGLTSNVVQDAAFDRDGNPWFATYDEGVFYFDGESFQNLRNKAELTSSTTFAIDIDADGSVWIGHNWGLDVYRIPFEDLQHYGSDQGFMGIEVNPGAIKHDGKGNIWMGTLMGLLRFTPAHFRLNITEPVTRITGATLGGKSLSEEEDSFQLDFNSSDFRVEFKGISLVNPGQNQYRYRLLGAHEEWRTKSNPSPIEYISLPPGEYTFELETCNNSGKCNGVAQQVKFNIRPPFYRSWWFYTLLFFAAILTIYLMDRYRVLSLLDEKNALEEKLTIKDQELIDVDIELSDLKAFKTYNQNLASQLTPVVADEQISSWFGYFSVQRLGGMGVSSDQFFDLKLNNIQMGGMIDVGVSGIMAGYMLELIKNSLLEQALEKQALEPTDCVLFLHRACQKAVQKLEKHRGIQWAIWLHTGHEKLMHLNGLSLYLLAGNEVHEVKAASMSHPDASKIDLIEVPRNEEMFMTSDGLLDVLSEDGTRSYGRNRLLSRLRESVDLPASGKFEVLSNDVQRFKGDMEQHDDITFIHCAHG